MRYTLASLQALYEELQRTAVISEDFKSHIITLAIDVAREASEAAEKRVREELAKKKD